jgi:hypothetical protein
MRTPRSIPVLRPMSVHPLRLVGDEQDDALPPCPAVRDGVTVRYMGTERRRVEGEATGFVYYADPSRRLIEVDRRDLLTFLGLRAFVLAD